MTPLISALADRSSVLYRVRDNFVGIADIVAMATGEWRDRLAIAVARSGKSMREVSLAAGRGAGYLHGVLKDGKEPTVDHLVAIINVLGTSISWVLAGVEVSADEEDLLRLYASLPDEERAALRRLAESISGRR